jgi:DNA-binding IclR family transcriptional regulator
VLPLHCTGVGKAILAHLPEQELERFLSSNSLDSYTPNTITDPDELKRHLIAVRQEGVAFDEEEKELGVSNVAAVIKDSDGNVVATVGILGPTTRLTRQKIRECVPIIKSHALKISRALGYEGE